MDLLYDQEVFIMVQLVHSNSLKAVHTIWCQVLEERSCWLLPVRHLMVVGVRFVGRSSQTQAPRRPTRKPSMTMSPTSARVAKSTNIAVASGNTDRVAHRPWVQILSSSIIITLEGSDFEEILELPIIQTQICLACPSVQGTGLTWRREYLKRI
ncbi:uncharacterized protein LOC124274995 [Haliotis rubra]|uniref:uncharacterized protein LOC124274995 n=1 Tax=Haliotis rubra TaxID=36100 RepID=UPI001EE5BE31|nr:uncharacterized protein LOC124274995 [Haliotis rubra]